MGWARLVSRVRPPPERNAVFLLTPMDFSKSNLTRDILIAMAAGTVVGVTLYATGWSEAQWARTYLIDGLFEVVGDVFVKSLTLLVVPLVLVSLVCGTAALDDVRKLGSIGVKTVGLYLFTTCVAITLAIAAATFFGIGEGFEVKAPVDFEPEDAPPLLEVVKNLFPSNPFKAMAEGNMLQVIVFAILLGIALVLSGEPGQRVLGLFRDFNEVVMRFVFMVMLFAPYGVFAKLVQVFATTGWDAVAELGGYFLLVLVVLLFHGAVVYPTLLTLLGRLSPVPFFRKMRGVQAFAFSTASSNATIPVNLANAQRKLGAHNEVASFTIPLGATINMDGTAIMQGVATVFIANIYAQIDLTLAQYAMVIGTATIASIGTAGVPGVGLITLAMVLRQANLPVEYITLIIGIDRLLDMARTAVNVTGDAAVTCLVAKSEGQLDEDVFAGPDPDA